MSQGLITQAFEKATLQWQSNGELFGVVDSTDPSGMYTHRPIFQFGPTLRAQAGEVKVVSGRRMLIPREAKTPRHVSQVDD